MPWVMDRIVARVVGSVGCVLALLAAAVLVSPARTTTAPTKATPPLQAAVLRDGFAILEAVGDRHVVEVNRSGIRRKRSAIPTVTDTRAIGSARGAAVAYLERKKLNFAVIKEDGSLGKPQAFGTSVRAMCDGLATNDQRWAVAYLEERDDRLWFVHGPTHPDSPGALEAMAFDIDLPAPANWCAIRSANDYVALVYRVGQKTFVNMCSKKECAGMQTRVPIDARDEIMDIACQREGCAVAVRAADGSAFVGAFNQRGKVTWKKKLAYATRDKIQLAAAGDRAYVMSLMTEEGPVVERMLSKNGSSGRAWHGAPGLSAPAMAWSKDHMMITYWDGNALAHDVWVMQR